MSAVLSIGALSRATGIPASTLRTWERRYGVPRAQRSRGNQRVYDPALVPHLTLAAAAIEQGHRAAHVLTAPRADVERLVAEAAPRTTEPLDGWIAATMALDGPGLDRQLRTEAGRRALLSLLDDCVVPFLVEVGRRWEAGELEIFQEHFASERVRAFLSARWQELAATAPGAPVVCATLPGDQHDLGLHLAAVAIALAGRRVVYVGRDTPLSDIAAAARRTAATAVAVSVAAGAPPRDTASALADLRDLLGGVALWVGGGGAPDVPGVARPGALSALHRLATA